MPEGQLDTGRITHLPQMHRDVAWKSPVRAATTADGTLATAFDNGSVIDGVTLATDDRILIKDQTATEANGIYVVQASGEPFRTYDMDDDGEFAGAMVYVMEGTANAGKLFVCTTPDPVVQDVTGLTFEEFAGGGGGGVEVPVDHGSMGATETLDMTAGTWHRGTLTADCTITVSGFVADEAVTAIVKVIQNGTGGHAIIWDPDVIFGSGADDQPSQGPADVTFFSLWSDEGDSAIYAAKIGASPISDHDDLSNVTANQHHNQVHAIDGADHTLSGAAVGDVLTATSATTFAFQSPSAASAFIPVDTGAVTYDTTDPDVVEVLVETVWGIDASDDPYYDAGFAVTGEEAALYWDPANAQYVLVPYSFP